MLMEQKKRRNSLAAQEAQRQREERLRKEKEQQTRAKREKQRQKQVRKERNSRAAQTAQRQREERKEDTRLDGLRQKQRKEAKQRTKKRVGPAFWRNLFIMAGIAVAVVLTMVIFFRVRHIEVVGISYYTDEDVTQACGVEEGDNLLTLSRGEIAGNIMARLDYVKSVRVTRKLPDTVVLTITEYPATYAITDQAGNYYLITSAGEAMEMVEEKEAKKHTLITDLEINTPVLGEPVSIAAKEGRVPQSCYTALTEVLQALEAADLVQNIASVSVPSAHNVSLWYSDRFEVFLGSTERLDYKLEFLKEVISQQKSYATGTIDLTLEQEDAARVKLNE